MMSGKRRIGWLFVVLLFLIGWGTGCVARQPASVSKEAATAAVPGAAPSRPLVIAHRGARSLAPENTLAAARQAWAAGADLWELDVTLTADKEAVVMHDDTLRRTCNVEEVFPQRQRQPVGQFTLTEVQNLDCGSWFNEEDPFGQIAAGAVSEADQRSYVGEQAPSLRRALEWTLEQGWRVNVELKRQPTAQDGRVLVEKTVALIEELGLGDSAVISSFEHDYLALVEQAAFHPTTQAVSSKHIRDLPAYLNQTGIDGCNPKAQAWSVGDLADLSQRGIALNVWTVNDEQTMRALINAGVSGIITDYPQRLVEMLSEQ